MAHSTPPCSRGAILAAITAAIWAVPAASALTLGEIEVHSALAEPFDATIAVDSSSGAKGGSECFTMGRAPGGVPGLARPTFAFETTAAGSRVRIRTKAAVNEPAVALRVNAACPGEGRVTRDYYLLLDVRSASSLPLRGTAAENAVRTTPSAPKAADLSASGFRAVAGDTLSRIAAAIFPRNRAAAAAYVEALRARNPHLASLGPDEAIAPGTVLALPDLYAFSKNRSPAAHAAPSISAAPAAPRSAAGELPAAPPAAKPQPSKPERAMASTSPAARGFRAVEGDTLAAIAATIFPRDRTAAAAYAEALRAANPALASLGPDEAIAPGTVLVLPDLYAFAKNRPWRAQSAPRASPAQAAPRAATPEPAPAQPVAKAPPPSPRAPAAAQPAPKAQSPAPRAPVPARSRAAPRAGKTGEFVLRLSAVEMDLSRSKGVDDRMRAQLRDRLLLLDADDQVAALLSLRNSVRQLESRVAELQLKMTTSPPRVATSPAPSDPVAPPSAPSGVAQVLPSAAPSSPPISTKPEPPPISTKPEQPPISIKPEPPPVEAKAEPKPEPPPVAKPSPTKAKPAEPAAETGWPAWLWGLVGLLVFAIGGLAWRLVRSRTPATAEIAGASTEISAGGDTQAGLAAENDFPDLAPPREGRAPRGVVGSDAELATRIPGADPEALRRRYIEERFPEIANGAIVLDNPDSVVKAARLLYEDGSIPRAVELLQFSVEDRPEQMKTWLALFEIFRLEKLTGEFAQLAQRFRKQHGTTDNWRKVQYIGRELDPANPLYHDMALDSLESVGRPSEGKARVVTFDPLAENWLNTPMDFTSDAVAANLRSALLADAGLSESDLVPNPIPALKSAEMFTVA
jgi:phage tail protein X